MSKLFERAKGCHFITWRRVEKYELEEVLHKSFFEEVLNESVLMGVDDNGLGVTDYAGVVNGRSGGLLNRVGFIFMSYVEVVFS